MGHRARGLQRRGDAWATSRTTTRGRAPTAGARTAWPACCDRKQIALPRRSPSGTGKTRCSRSALFGLTGPEGNHGEDVKERLFLRGRDPDRELPPLRLQVPAAPLSLRGADRRPTPSAARGDREVEIERPRRLRRRSLLRRRPSSTPSALADDILMVITVEQPRPRARRRCTCCRTSGSATPGRGAADGEPRPRSAARPATEAGRVRAPRTTSSASFPGTSRARPSCSSRNNETNTERLFGDPSRTPYVEGRLSTTAWSTGDDARGEPRAAAAPRPRSGTAHDPRGRPGARAACASRREPQSAPFDGADELLALRRREADEFYAAVQGPSTLTDERRAIQRQALARACSGRMQFYHYDVDTWLDGDPTPPPHERLQRPQRRLAPRLGRRRHLHARHLGVPVVRGLGPRLPRPRDGLGRHRSGQGPAQADGQGVVPAPERPDPRLRVGVQRSQPAGARLGGLPDLQDRAPPEAARATGTSSSGSSTSCSSTSPGG